MAKMTGAQAIVKSLKKYGIDTIFTLPGAQLDNLFNALYDEQDCIRTIHSRHESSAAYMAFGYAQASGKVGVCAVVPGPGLLNASAAILTANSSNVPVLVLAGQVPSAFIDKGFGHLHELPNQIDMIAAVAKWTARIENPEDTPGIIRDAFKHLLSGPTRPVVLEMAPDKMGLEADVGIMDAISADDAPEGDPELIEKAAKFLASAKKPIIFAGGGAQDAGEELLVLAEELQAPVALTVPGKGVVSDQHYLAQNRISGHRFWKEADVGLIVGSRFTQPLSTLGWGWDWEKNTKVKLIQIDILQGQIGQTFKPEVGIVADSKKCLTALINTLQKTNSVRKSSKPEMQAAKKESLEFLSAKFKPQADYAAILRQQLPEDGIFVTEATQVGYFCNVCFPVYHPRTFIQSGYQGNLGFGFASALGAKVATPDKKVISINGDGGFMYTSQELSTAVHHKINLVAVVFSDGAYSNVARIQEHIFNGKTIATELSNPDFVMYAKSFGAAARRAETPEALREAIREGFDADVPMVIEVPIGRLPFMNMY